jgi:hypothetical protein
MHPIESARGEHGTPHTAKAGQIGVDLHGEQQSWALEPDARTVLAKGWGIPILEPGSNEEEAHGSNIG